MFFLSFFSIHLKKATFLFEVIPVQKISVTQATSYVIYFNNIILISFALSDNKFRCERFKCYTVGKIN